MLKPFVEDMDMPRRFRACGRLIGIALSSGVKLGINFNGTFFELLRVVSPHQKTEIHPQFLSVEYLEAARIIRGGIADVVSYFMFHSLTGLELQQALL